MRTAPLTKDAVHADDCDPVEIDPADSPFGDEVQCNPRNGVWIQPPSHAYFQAENELDNAPWCRVHHRAFEIVTADSEPASYVITTLDEARRLGAVHVIDQLESPYKSYAEELANFYKWNYLEDAHEAFGELFGSPHGDDEDARDRFDELRMAFVDGYNAAAAVADLAAYNARPRGDEGVQAALARLRERDERDAG